MQPRYISQSGKAHEAYSIDRFMQSEFMPLHKKGGFLLSGPVMEMKKGSGASISHSAGDLNLHRWETRVFKGFSKASKYNIKKK